MNYFQRLHSKFVGAFDSVVSRQKGETLEEHREHCSAKPGNCPFDKREVEGLSEEDMHEPELSDKAESDDLHGGSMKERVMPIYRRITESGVVSDSDLDELRRIDEKVRAGTVKALRVPGDLMVGDRMPGVSGDIRILYHLLAASTNPYDIGTRKERARQEALVERFAKKTGMWEEDLEGFVDRMGLEKVAEGGESDVFFFGDSVLKINRPYIGSRTPLQAIERYMLFNFYFPESKTDIKGFGIAGGALEPFALVLQQDKFHIDPKAPPIELEEKLDYMYDKGFLDRDDEQSLGDGTEYESEDGRQISISDLHEENIVTTTDGERIVLDAFVELNENKGYDVDDPPAEMPIGEVMRERMEEASR